MKWLLPLVLLLSQAPANVKPAFEVVSVKKSSPGLRESMVNQPGRFAANNLTLRQLIAFAYRPANSHDGIHRRDAETVGESALRLCGDIWLRALRV